MSQPTVVASPLKVHVSQLPHAVKHSLGMGGGVAKSPTGGGGGSEGEGGGEGMGSEGEGGKREPHHAGTQPPKRIRLTRKSAGLGSSED